MASTISDVCFEQIRDNYWYGAYGEFRVVMMKDCGYINATKMCSSGGKDFWKWSRLKSSVAIARTPQAMVVLENTHASSMNHDLTLRTGHAPRERPLDFKKRPVWNIHFLSPHNLCFTPMYVKKMIS